MVSSYPPARCGIAAYAAQAVRRLRGEGHVVDVLSVDGRGDVDYKEQMNRPLGPMRLLIYTIFYDHVIIQYHPAFFFKYKSMLESYLMSLSLSIFFVFCRKVEVVCHEMVKHSGMILGNMERVRWWMTPRIIFHTQKEIDIFKNQMKWCSGRKITLRKQQEDFVRRSNISMADARAQLGLKEDSLIFLCIGFIQPSKGFERAIRAFRRIRNRNAVLYIAGSLRTPDEKTQNYRDGLVRMARETANVKIVDKYMADEDFDKWIISADYVVLPYREIWSSGIAGRAKLFNKPVIASRVGGLENQLERGDYHFDSDQELEGIMCHIADGMELSLGKSCQAWEFKGECHAVMRGFESNMDFESVIQHIYQTILQDGDVAVDVGAHVGRHCIPMAQSVYPGGRIYAVEPLPQCRKTLSKLISRNYYELEKIIHIMPYALSHYSGKSTFVIARDALGYSGLKERIYDTPTRLKRIKVEVNTLDNLFSHFPSLRYIKIDAEGGEYDILRGAIQCINKFRPLLTFEFGAQSIGEYKITPEDVARLLYDNGYNIIDINGRHLKLPEFVKSAYEQKIWDYIAIPVEDRLSEEKIMRLF